ncbi:monomeric sarcosine oxidase-like [Glandiceps talaboti]
MDILAESMVRHQAAKCYDICIVGAGLIGSAAARHATLTTPNLKVCLIGPREPKTLTEKLECEHGIFGAHYDEGRTTRSLDSDAIYAELGKRSISRYREIEQRTGIRFYSNVGHMSVTLKGDPFLEQIKDNAKKMDIEVNVMDRTGIRRKYPYLSLNPGEEAVLQMEDAGHVSARNTVLAQQTAAHLQGCDIIDDIVDKVSESIRSDGSKLMKVTTAKGQEIHAKRVLLSTGAFTGFRDLLPSGQELDVTLLTQDVTFAEIVTEDAMRLKDMPVVILKHKVNEMYYYILPPIKYPDGKFYLKIGRRSKRRLHTADEVSDWYKSGGDQSTRPHLLHTLLDLVTGVNVVSTHSDTGVTTHTPTRQVYCDMITPTLGITVGGNGVGAKLGDEIGRMGANMIVAGRWDHDLPKEKFKARFKGKQHLTAKL